MHRFGKQNRHFAFRAIDRKLPCFIPVMAPTDECGRFSMKTKSRPNLNFQLSRRGRGRVSPVIHYSCSLICVGLTCGVLLLQHIYWLRVLHSSIDTYRLENNAQGHHHPFPPSQGGDLVPGNITINYADGKISTAFLIFRFPHHSGQGTGNIISGTLAAHLLAEEFNRTICHVYGHDSEEGKSSSSTSSFRSAFAWKDEEHQNLCDNVFLQIEARMNKTKAATIVQNNFDHTSEQSECSMRDLLSNHKDYPIVYYEGNTYPRWPTSNIKKRDYFHELLKPTESLLQILPWKTPPATVVHLRDGDGAYDERSGLDDQTLNLLARGDFVGENDGGNKENMEIYLVTNNVKWYKHFPKWSHPDWSLVHHSAMDRISWGNEENKYEEPNTIPKNGNKIIAARDNSHANENRDKNAEALQMWADWYTLLNANRVYHTHSDFSRSASRWNEGIESFTIQGSSTDARDLGSSSLPHLVLQNDNGEAEMKRLVDRKSEELWFCGGSTTSNEERQHIKEKQHQQLLSMIRRRKSQYWNQDSYLG